MAQSKSSFHAFNCQRFDILLEIPNREFTGALSDPCWASAPQFAQQDTTLMSDGEKRRLEAKQRSRLARDNSNSLTKLLEFKKRLASNQALGNQSEEPSQWPAAVSRHDKVAACPVRTLQASFVCSQEQFVVAWKG